MESMGPITIGIVVVAVVVVVLAIISRRGEGGGNSRVPVPRANQATEEDVRKIAMAGQKIQAIKLYREMHHVGLKEAKEAVERMLD